MCLNNAFLKVVHSGCLDWIRRQVSKLRILSGCSGVRSLRPHSSPGDGTRCLPASHRHSQGALDIRSLGRWLTADSPAPQFSFVSTATAWRWEQEAPKWKGEREKEKWAEGRRERGALAALAAPFPSPRGGGRVPKTDGPGHTWCQTAAGCASGCYLVAERVFRATSPPIVVVREGQPEACCFLPLQMLLFWTITAHPCAAGAPSKRGNFLIGGVSEWRRELLRAGGTQAQGRSRNTLKIISI